ncbi:unnamed protein product [Calypogeia fissa]
MDATEITDPTIRKEWSDALHWENCRKIKYLLHQNSSLLHLGWRRGIASLIELPAITDFSLKRPRTALHVAARRGDLELVKEILDMPRDEHDHAKGQDHEDCPKSTNCYLLKIVDGDYDLDALAIAVITGSPEIVKVLKQASLRCTSSNPFDILKNGKYDPESKSESESKQPSGETIFYTKGMGESATADYEYLATQYGERPAALAKIIDNITTEKRKFDFESAEKLRTDYEGDCDFNFLPMSLYLFHFLFSANSGKTDAEIKTDVGIAKEILRQAEAWAPGEATGSARSLGENSSKPNLELVKYLLFTLWDGQGRTALHVAVANQKVKKFRSTLPPKGEHEEIDDDYLNVRDSVGRTPLYRAAAENIEESAEDLLKDDRILPDQDIEYGVHKWGPDLDLDKLSKKNSFKSDSVYLTLEKLKKHGFKISSTSQAGPGSSVQSDLTAADPSVQSVATKASSIALHSAIIHKQVQMVNILLAGGASAQTCNRLFCWPYLRDDDQKLVIQTSASTMQLAVLVGSTRLYAPLLKSKKMKRRRIDPKPDPFLLAASVGNPDAIKAFLDNGQDPLIKDASDGNTALHFALMGKYVKLRPHLIDFVSCRHVSTRRKVSDDSVSAWLADAFDTELEAEMSGKSKGSGQKESEGSSEADPGFGQRKGCINLLLQAGINILQQNYNERSARPKPSAPEEFVTWWYDKVADQTQKALEKFTAAANAISVTATLVATASYNAPFTPPLGYDDNGVSVHIVPVRVFVVCSSLSFYFALAAIMFSLLPALPMPQESTIKELLKTRILVTIALAFLLPSIGFFLMAFAAGYIAVTPDNGMAYNGLTVSTTVIGGVICLVASVRFFFRFVNVSVSLPADVTKDVNVTYEFLPIDEIMSIKSTCVRILKDSKIFRAWNNWLSR